MENIILSGMLKEFVARFDLGSESVDKQFEKFANYCLLKTDHYDSFEFDKVSTGSATGVDGVAVVIGGVIVDEMEDARAFTKAQFDCSFYFVQAKTSNKFDLKSFLIFSNIVRAFFQDEKQALPNELHKAFDIKNIIYERSAKMRKLPAVCLYYVYTGEFSVDSTTVLSSIDSEIKTLKDNRYKFSNVSRRVIDGVELSRLYRDTKNDVIKKIPFQRHTALPSMKGASAAYLGVARCADYVSLISKESGELNKGLFFENVRDFLGEQNPVNSGIAKTIRSPGERDRFAVLNNGVTIVATKVEPSGDFFTISRFQVVNGCQTSHVLHKNKDRITEEMYITVKLIETSDIDLYGRIIATTNSQSLVTKEAFATIKPYHKKLEDFFNAMTATGDSKYEFYYERRPHQFDDREDVPQYAIVTPPSLIKSFISVIMEEPHKVHYYYGRLLEEYNQNDSSEIFAEGDYPGLYFASHLIVAKTRTELGRRRDSKLNVWVFHIGMLIKRQIAPELQKKTSLRDHKFLQLLTRIEDGFSQAFTNALTVIEQRTSSRVENRYPAVTNTLINQINQLIKSSNVSVSSLDGSRFRLANGQYVGTIREVSGKGSTLTIEYGPFVLNASATESVLKILRPGSRVMFNVRGSIISVLDVE